MEKKFYYLDADSAIRNRTYRVLRPDTYNPYFSYIMGSEDLEDMTEEEKISRALYQINNPDRFHPDPDFEVPQIFQPPGEGKMITASHTLVDIIDMYINNIGWDLCSPGTNIPLMLGDMERYLDATQSAYDSFQTALAEKKLTPDNPYYRDNVAKCQFFEDCQAFHVMLLEYWEKFVGAHPQFEKNRQITKLSAKEMVSKFFNRFKSDKD